MPAGTLDGDVPGIGQAIRTKAQHAGHTPGDDAPRSPEVLERNSES